MNCYDFDKTINKKDSEIILPFFCDKILLLLYLLLVVIILVVICAPIPKFGGV